MADLTRRAIRASFLKLLEESPISKITVKDIAAECGINRNTFYYHYQDIPALLLEIVKEDSDRLIRDYPTIDSLEEAIRVACRLVMDNRKVMQHIYHSVNRDIFENYLWEICAHVVEKYFDTIYGGRKISAFDRETLINYYKCECFGQVIYWLENGLSDTAMQQFQRICELKKDQIEELIRKCEESEANAVK
ncbi:MAG: TetR/AcrR family transcriptional regulator C-terminal domain-containing protein [Lachnospiraceae bacterium]|nr:TetR/AcrR family transcriptional regulator C-terminal domain-containing protein [Lachnospiraceae bacterium]MBQ2041451.1 TetR/AcrR family transcriptional regulator C-terminal domain-containing protein [Lachnospiraceae bacterium]